MSSGLTYISVVIPVYNSERTIGPLVEGLISEMGGSYRLEIILVNDCSKDQSSKACRDLYKRHPNIVRYYGLAKNAGEHNAVMAGLNQMHGDFVVIMDDDFQNPISEVFKLIEKSGEGFDVVYSFYEEKKHSLFRNWGSQFNDIVANIMLKKPRNLYLSSFKLIRGDLVKKIIEYDFPFPYLDGLILRLTENIGRVKVEHGDRREGRSGYTLVKLISLWLNMFTNFSIFPLRVSVILGLIFSLFGLTLGIYTMVEKFLNPAIPIGYPSTVVAISIFSGIQLMSIGMIGEYVGRIFLSINKTPQYVIREILADTDKN